MRGTVKIYHGYDGTPVLEESNLIVDGFKEHIVDIMTRLPAPSEVSGDVSASYDVSNFAVQALSLAPNYSNFERIHSLAAASGYRYDTGTGNAVYSGLNPLDGNAWVYREDMPNHMFSGVNWSGSPSVNNSLKNPFFSSVNSYLQNGKFRDYTLNNGLSSVFINEVLSLYELPGWDINSWLRYEPSATDFVDTYKAGSCSRYNMNLNIESVSSVYSMLSAVDYAEPDDGILYIRSFDGSSTGVDSLSTVSISQAFRVYDEYMEPWVSKIDTNSIVAEITAQFSSVAGADGACILVELEDITDGDFYNFEAQGSFDRHSWGSSGSPLILDASAGLSATLSKFVNIPKEKVKNTFKVSYQFYSYDSSDILKCLFWNANVNTLQGWFTGNIHKYGDIARVKEDDFTNPGLHIYMSGVNQAITNTELSNVTYITQKAKLNPTKHYSLNFFCDQETTLTPSTDYLNAAIIKRFSSNVEQIGKYNLLATLTASALNETRLLNAPYAISPEIPQTAVFKGDEEFSEPKPSDLCLEVSSSVVSGSFELPTTTPCIFKGKVLKAFSNGLSASNAVFTLQTSGLDDSGNPRKFNFQTGAWDVSGEYTTFNTSSVFDSGRFSTFQSIAINPTQLASLGVESVNGSYPLILSVSSADSNPCFVKELRMDSIAKDLADEVQELRKFTSESSITNSWVSALSGQYLFSGQTETLVAPKVWPQFPVGGINFLAYEGVQGMIASNVGIHSSESVYDVFIGHCKGNPGQFVTVNSAYLTDCTLLLATEEFDSDILTSESYFAGPRRSIIDQPFMVLNDASTVYPTTFYLRTTPATKNDNLSQLPNPQGLLIGGYANPGGGAREPVVSLAFNYSLSNFTLPTSSIGIAFSLDYDIAVNNAEPEVAWRACANTKTGKTVWWDATNQVWVSSKVGEEPYNSFVYTFYKGGSNELKFNRTSPIPIDNKEFDENTVITLYTTFYDFDGTDFAQVKNWKIYNVTEEATRDLPVFPEPDDRTVQPIQSPAGLQGQFANNIQYNTSSITAERALGSANWVSRTGTSALAIPGVGALDSTHNNAAAVNSDGFVYSGYAGLSTGSLALSGFYASATASSMVYVIDFADYEIDAFDSQGGVGAIGLWAFDVDKTYQKLLDNGHSLSAIYDKTSPWAGGLYTLDDETRNPVFKLLAKKVFKTPITYPTGTANTPLVRIVWEINFL